MMAITINTVSPFFAFYGLSLLGLAALALAALTTTPITNI